MRLAILAVGLLACQASSKPELAIVGHGVKIVPAPSTSAALMENGVLIFGPPANAPLPTEIKNVAVKPGKPPTAPLQPRPFEQATIYSDGAPDTTAVVTGVGMTSFDGVLAEVTLSTRAGAWTIVFDGKDQEWAPGRRLDVGADGHSFKLEAVRSR